MGGYTVLCTFALCSFWSGTAFLGKERRIVKEKLETIRNTAREMLMRPGGMDATEWGSIWRLSCRVLDELKGVSKKTSVEFPVQYGTISVEVVEHAGGTSHWYDAVVKISNKRFLGINFTPDEEREDGEEALAWDYSKK